MEMQEILAKKFSQKLSRAQAVITVQVYLELIELKRYYNVAHKFVEGLNKIIITGNKYKETPMCAFIPVTVTEYLDFSILQKFIKTHTCPLTFLAIVDTDSTTVYYQIQDGLVEPDDTTAKHSKIDKRLQLDRDIEKSRKFIEEAALYSSKVTISKNSSNAEVETPININDDTSEIAGSSAAIEVP